MKHGEIHYWCKAHNKIEWEKNCIQNIKGIFNYCSEDAYKEISSAAQLTTLYFR